MLLIASPAHCAITGEPYRGINIVLLWSEAVARGFVSPIWMTFRQAIELGGHVRKGETGSMVVYANRVAKTETDENGDEVEREIAFLKSLHGLLRRSDRRFARPVLCGHSGRASG